MMTSSGSYLTNFELQTRVAKNTIMGARKRHTLESRPIVGEWCDHGIKRGKGESIISYLSQLCAKRITGVKVVPLKEKTFNVVRITKEKTGYGEFASKLSYDRGTSKENRNVSNTKVRVRGIY